jgi:hypothetical protein
MTELTDAKLHLAMLGMRILRIRGQIPETEPLSPERMAAVAKDLGIQLDAKTIRTAIDDSLHLARLALSALPETNTTPTDTP